mmetsp:Transcript_13032/g.28156  ORF Transcript_13032/g.28156 Transcript_13032/m.28156 type:complete len:376 (-) Transcript_13032:775-1902(-)
MFLHLDKRMTQHRHIISVFHEVQALRRFCSFCCLRMQPHVSAFSTAVLLTAQLLSFHGADAFATVPAPRASTLEESCTDFETNWCKPELKCTSTNEKDKCSAEELAAAKDECQGSPSCFWCRNKIQYPIGSLYGCKPGESTVVEEYRYCNCDWDQETPDAQIEDVSPPPPSPPPPLDCISFAFESKKTYDYDDLYAFEISSARESSSFPQAIMDMQGDAWCQTMTTEESCVDAATITGLPNQAAANGVFGHPCEWTGSECVMSAGKTCPAACLPLIDRVEAPRMEIDQIKNQDLQEDDLWCSAVGLYVNLANEADHERAANTCNSVYVTFIPASGAQMKRPCVWIPNADDPRRSYCAPWKSLGAACSGDFSDWSS